MQIDITRGKLTIEATHSEWEQLHKQVSPDTFPAKELNFAIYCLLQQETRNDV